MGYIGPGARGRIDNFDLLRSLWERGVSTKAIADVFGVMAPAVCSRARSLNLPPRNLARGQTDAAGAAAVAPRPDPAVKTKTKAMPAHPFWTPERDIAVMATAGRNAALAELAAMLGRSIADVTLRWHRLRAN